MKKKKCFAVLAALFLCLMLAAGCGAASEPAASYAAVEPAAAPAAEPIAPQAAPDMAAGEPAGEPAGEATGGGMVSAALPQDGRSVVLTAFIDLEATDFDAACQKIQAAAEQSGGYLSATRIYAGDGSGGRNASFVARVPAQAYAAFVTRLDEAGKMTNRSEQSEDVTDQVVDIEARLKSLRTQETRLLAMMEETGALSDVILIQDQLAQVQYEIESYVGLQRGLKDRIRYSTVNLEVREVRQLSETVEDGYLSRIGAAFRGSWRLAGEVVQSIGLAAVWLLPLLPAAAVLAVVLACVRRRRKRRAQNPPAPAAVRPGPAPVPGRPYPPFYGAPYAPYAPYPAPRIAPPAAGAEAPTPNAASQADAPPQADAAGEPPAASAETPAQSTASQAPHSDPI